MLSLGQSLHNTTYSYGLGYSLRHSRAIGLPPPLKRGKEHTSSQGTYLPYYVGRWLRQDSTQLPDKGQYCTVPRGSC